LSWQFADDVQEICKPFFEKLGITYTDYARFYPDGRVILLGSDKHYVNYFLNDKAFYDKTPNKIISTGFHLWSEYIDPSFLSRASAKFHYSHGVTIITEMNNYQEVFNIATYPDNHKILDFYLNYQSIIQQMIAYFRHQAKKLIHKFEDKPLIIPTAIKYALSTPPLDKLSQEITKLINSEFSSCTIQVNNIAIPLSRREAQCLYLLHQGKTTKEIGKILDISHRTIEIYLNQIRLKITAKNRIELLSKIDRSQVQNLACTLEQ
jgi:DNA-binding CsgD family transcriptional regulator